MSTTIKISYRNLRNAQDLTAEFLKKCYPRALLCWVLLLAIPYSLHAGVVTNIYDTVDGCSTGSGGDDPSGGTDPGTPPNINPPSLLPADNGPFPGSCASCSSSGDSSCLACAFGDDDSRLPPFNFPGPGGLGGFGISAAGLIGRAMPIWRVSEPYINLWLYDEPVAYQPGFGPAVAFGLAYKQRGGGGISSAVSPWIYGLGSTNWMCSWLSYVEDDGVGAQAILNLRRGGVVVYAPPNGSSIEYYTHTTLLRETNSSGALTGFIRTYPSGARDYYFSIPQYAIQTINGNTVAFLTARTDPAGRTNLLFTYQSVPVGAHGHVFQLSSVTDADGHVNSLSYTNSNQTLITGVTDPFGRFAVLRYDSSGRLTNITDVANLSSSFRYDSQNWITNLATPYGTTTFQHLDNGFITTNSDGSDYTGVIRAIRVVDPASGTNIYMLRQNSVFSYFANLQAPSTGYLLDDVCQYGVCFVQYRDSFHWGPLQAAGLASDMNTYTNTDCIKARMRHWFHATTNCTNEAFLSQALSLQIEPSPDGSTLGQCTWYSYDGMQCQFHEGTNSLPAFVGRIIPGGYTWNRIYQRDAWGRPTNITESYSAGNNQSALNRTYQYAYNGSDLVTVTGPHGKTLAGYAYTTNHLLLRATNAVNDVTYYSYDAHGRLTSVTTPAGLTRTNIYFSSGSYTNFVETAIDLQISRTNSYTYTNDVVASHTDERGLATTMSYDNLDRLLSSSDTRGTISYVYNKLDLVTVVDRLGFTNSHTYDNVRRRTSATDASGRTTYYNYCTCGALESITDAAGYTNYFTYDNAGRHVETSYPDGYTVYYDYDRLDQMTNTYDNAGESLTNWFDNQGLLYAAQDAAGTTFFFAYDDEDRITNSYDANGVPLTMTYDELGRLLTRTYVLRAKLTS